MPNVYHKEAWIYLAETSPDEEEDASTFDHKFKRHDGFDPEYINRMYRDESNKIQLSAGTAGAAGTRAHRTAQEWN